MSNFWRVGYISIFLNQNFDQKMRYQPQKVKNTESQKMVSERLKPHYLRLYEKFSEKLDLLSYF